MTKATIEYYNSLKTILNNYTVASGQIFNYEKSSMLSRGNTLVGQIATVNFIFLAIYIFSKKYLGLPFIVDRKKLTFFNDNKLKVLNKTSN